MISIDIDNAPHVVLFRPIIDRLKKDGFEVIVTARDYGNTIDLLKLYNIEFIKVGGYGGKSKVKKVMNLLHRVYQLVSFVKKNELNIRLSINHGSRTHCIASKLMGIKTISMGDYEHTELKIISTFSDYFFTPENIDKDILLQKGFKKDQLIFYPGLKENIYLWKSEIKKLDFIPKDKIIVVLRPPSFTANYVAQKSIDLFEAIMDRLLKNSQIFTVCLPRTKEQGEYIKNNFDINENFFIPNNALDGASLLYVADIVISGGGTMNREATVFGCKVYSIFGGTLPSIDINLQKEGKLEFIRDVSEIDKINFSKKQVPENNSLSSDTFDFVYDKIIKIYK